jgi:glycosyltransferase involved in cell wall biosynthesis
MRVLHYYNWGYFAPISCGADVIASNQLEYLHHKGWEVDCLLAHNPERSHQSQAFRDRYPWVRSVQLVVPPPAANEWSFRGQFFCYSQIARFESFRQLVREGHDLFFTNYVFTAPLLEQFPRGCTRLLEAHDLISNSFALNERLSNPGRDPLASARDDFLRNMEMELYKLFDGVLFINEQESNLVQADHPGRTHFIPPMMPWETRPAATGGNTTMFTRERFDLIFVGSNAAPNVRGLTAFYRQIFVPYLRKHRVRLAVIGNVCDRLDFDDWYVTKLGVVKGDLEEHYAQSKVVVIPILEGSGLSIKTIESLAQGRAVVTTPVGARGLAHDPEAFVQVDMVSDPGGTARAILELLDSESLRKRMQRTAQDYYRTNFGRERYFNAMDRVMSSLGICA